MNVHFLNTGRLAIQSILVLFFLLTFASVSIGQQLTQAQFAILQAQFDEFNFSEDVNIIEIAADQLSAESLQDAVNIAAQTTEDDLIIIHTDFHNDTLLLYGNPITIDVDSTNFGSVTIVALSPTGTPLIVDTQELSRAFRINNGDVALG